MKTFTFCLVAFFCTLLSFGQAQTNSVALSSFSKTTMSADRAKFASIENTKYDKAAYANMYRESIADRCNRAKKMRTAGIVLSAVGGGLLITGIALITIGVHDEANDINNGGDGLGGFPLIAGGAVCTVFGIGGIGAGIPLAIIGSVHAHKYCGGGSRDRDRSYMELSTKGNGLALNF